MAQKMKSGDRQIKAFESSLTKILGADNFPREALGDLSMLLDALKRGTNMLTGLMEFRRSFERRPAAKLQELEIALDDVRDILKDVLPVLRKMTKTAYRVCETHEDKETVKRLLKKVELLQSTQGDREV